MHLLLTSFSRFSTLPSIGLLIAFAVSRGCRAALAGIAHGDSLAQSSDSKQEDATLTKGIQAVGNPNVGSLAAVDPVSESIKKFTQHLREFERMAPRAQHFPRVNSNVGGGVGLQHHPRETSDPVERTFGESSRGTENSGANSAGVEFGSLIQGGLQTKDSDINNKPSALLTPQLRGSLPAEEGRGGDIGQDSNEDFLPVAGVLPVSESDFFETGGQDPKEHVKDNGYAYGSNTDGGTDENDFLSVNHFEGNGVEAPPDGSTTNTDEQNSEEDKPSGSALVTRERVDVLVKNLKNTTSELVLGLRQNAALYVSEFKKMAEDLEKQVRLRSEDILSSIYAGAEELQSNSQKLSSVSGSLEASMKENKHH